jgi:hypothetical protein
VQVAGPGAEESCEEGAAQSRSANASLFMMRPLNDERSPPSSACGRSRRMSARFGG